MTLHRALIVVAALGLAGLVGYCNTLAAQPVTPVGLETPQYDVSDLEKRVLREVNRVRLSNGLTALQSDSRLVSIARTHSRDMYERAFVAHRNPSGWAPGERALRAGYMFREFGENLFRGRLYDVFTQSGHGTEQRTFYLWHTPDELAELVARMWMESPSHRENMLADRYDYGGVGVALGSDHEVLVTLNLSAR